MFLSSLQKAQEEGRYILLSSKEITNVIFTLTQEGPNLGNTKTDQLCSF